MTGQDSLKLLLVTALLTLGACVGPPAERCTIQGATEYTERGKQEVLVLLRAHGDQPLEEGGHELSTTDMSEISAESLNLISSSAEGTDLGFTLVYADQRFVDWEFSVTYDLDCSSRVSWGRRAP